MSGRGTREQRFLLGDFAGEFFIFAGKARQLGLGLVATRNQSCMRSAFVFLLRFAGFSIEAELLRAPQGITSFLLALFQIRLGAGFSRSLGCHRRTRALRVVSSFEISEKGRKDRREHEGYHEIKFRFHRGLKRRRASDEFLSPQSPSPRDRAATVQLAPRRWTPPAAAPVDLPKLMLCHVVPTSGGEFRLRPIYQEWLQLNRRTLQAMGLERNEQTIRRLGIAGFIRTRRFSKLVVQFHVQSLLDHLAAVEAHPEFWDRPDNARRWRESYAEGRAD